MFPGMTFMILSRDPDCVADMAALIQGRQGRVYVATSWAEVQRSEAEITFEILVVNPWFWAV